MPNVVGLRETITSKLVQKMNIVLSKKIVLVEYLLKPQLLLKNIVVFTSSNSILIHHFKTT
jgi:hypothetical protein